MADIWQTKAALIASTQDNTSGAITAQVLRNVITSTNPVSVFISGNYTLSLNDSWVCAKPSGSASYSITLPDAVSASGKMYYIYKESDITSTLTVLPSGSQTIGGASSATMISKYAMLETYSDGSGWENVYNSDYLGWKDIVGDVSVRTGGPTSPGFTAIAGNTSGYYAYELTNGGGEYLFNYLHMPHDYAPGTDMYIHAHFIANDNTANWAKFDFLITYARGYNNGQFISTTTNISASGQVSTSGSYTHQIAEVKFTAPAGASGLVDTNKLETDGVFMVRTNRNSGDSYASSVWVLFIDIHYQTRKVSTINRNYPFD